MPANLQGPRASASKKEFARPMTGSGITKPGKVGNLLPTLRVDQERVFY